MTILALNGSLRKTSSNGMLLSALRNYFSSLAAWDEFDISTVPYFDPELQFSEKLPPQVLELRALAAACDVIVIASPEYAHGIPGVLKNGLEWLLFEGVMKKKVLAIVGAPDGQFARVQLLETLKTMDFTISEMTCIVIKSLKNAFDESGKIIDKKIDLDLKNAVKFVQL